MKQLFLIGAIIATIPYHSESSTQSKKPSCRHRYYLSAQTPQYIFLSANKSGLPKNKISQTTKLLLKEYLQRIYRHTGLTVLETLHFLIHPVVIGVNVTQEITQLPRNRIQLVTKLFGHPQERLAAFRIESEWKCLHGFVDDFIARIQKSSLSKKPVLKSVPVPSQTIISIITPQSYHLVQEGVTPLASITTIYTKAHLQQLQKEATAELSGRPYNALHTQWLCTYICRSPKDFTQPSTCALAAVDTALVQICIEALWHPEESLEQFMAKINNPVKPMSYLIAGSPYAELSPAGFIWKTHTHIGSSHPVFPLSTVRHTLISACAQQAWQNRHPQNEIVYLTKNTKMYPPTPSGDALLLTVVHPTALFYWLTQEQIRRTKDHQQIQAKL